MKLWLETPRLHLRTFEPRDAGALAAYRNDPEVSRHQGWALPFSEKDALDLIQAMQTRTPGESGWTQIALQEKTSGALIGDLALRGAPPAQAEIGFTLAVAFQGQGYATEALSALLDYAFGPLSLHRVFASLDPRNAASARLLSRLGFRHEGTLLESYLLRGVWTDDAQYALLAREYRQGLG